MSLVPSDGRAGTVNLLDLSGPLEVAAILTFTFAMNSLRRRDLSLTTLTHTLSMACILGVGGHFLEEHALGRPRQVELLQRGFAGFSTSGGYDPDEYYDPPRRTGLAGLLALVWELSGVLALCAAVLFARLWHCGLHEDDPSCIADSTALASGSRGKDPHRRCRHLRLRLYVPVFVAYWCGIILAIGARFNSILGGSAIRPTNDNHYFGAVMNDCRKNHQKM